MHHKGNASERYFNACYHLVFVAFAYDEFNRRNALHPLHLGRILARDSELFHRKTICQVIMERQFSSNDGYGSVIDGLGPKRSRKGIMWLVCPAKGEGIVLMVSVALLERKEGP